jgi:hypothetical protein
MPPLWLDPVPPFQALEVYVPPWPLLVLLLIACAALAWTLVHALRVRMTVRCPIQRRPARVLFALDATGRAVDVLACSLLGTSGRVTCAKTCLPGGGGR